MIEYSWLITKLFVVSEDPIEGIVVKVEWAKQGIEVETGIKGIYCDTIDITWPEDFSSFIPLESLTKEQVLTWVQQAVNSTYPVDIIDNYIQNQIKDKKYMPTEAEVSWLDTL